MLKLDFKIGSRLLIGDNIWMEILKIHEGQVGIGITAPPEVPVNREHIAVEKGIVTAAQASGVARARPIPESEKARRRESESPVPLSRSPAFPLSAPGHPPRRD